METNELKRKNHANQAVRLKIALRYGFFVEAVAIEYGMIEDRLHSILKYAGLPIEKKNGKRYSIQENINRIKDGVFFNQKQVRKLIPRELLEEIELWKQGRNTVIHSLLITEFGKDQIKVLAIKGDDLRKRIDNASGRVKNYVVKLAEKA